MELDANIADLQSKLIVWIFAMRFLMDFMSGVSYFINQVISEKKYRGLTEFGRAAGVPIRAARPAFGPRGWRNW